MGTLEYSWNVAAILAISANSVTWVHDLFKEQGMPLIIDVIDQGKDRVIPDAIIACDSLILRDNKDMFKKYIESGTRFSILHLEECLDRMRQLKEGPPAELEALRKKVYEFWCDYKFRASRMFIIEDEEPTAP
jgi:hypothetical protein